MEPKHLKFLECLCVKPADASLSSTATITSKLTADVNLRATPVAVGTVKADLVKVKFLSTTINNTGTISAKISGTSNIKSSLNAIGQLIPKLTAKYAVKQRLNAETELRNTRVEKLSGDFGDYECVQKLFPVEDVAVDLQMGKFVGPNIESGNLYSFIDEGIFVGDYDKPFGQSYLIVDDNNYIQPHTYHTAGKFQYKAKVTDIFIKPELSRFRMRASAPLRNYESRIPPRYTIDNIKLSDPFGNLVIQYNDIIFRGDADQENRPSVNYTTFSSAPKINNTTQYYEWQNGYPFMHERSNYTISFDVKIEALDDPFEPGFDLGFEEFVKNHISYGSGDDYLSLDGASLSTQNQTLINPAKNIRISAIEICNSGLYAGVAGYGPRPENYLKLYTEVPQKGRRIERKISPMFMPLATFDTGIWPSVSSIWVANDLSTANNLTKCGAEHIVYNLSNDADLSYATLHTIGPILDSGKLTLSFAPSNELFQVTDGAFNSAFNQSIINSWYHPSGAFNTENKNTLQSENGFFTVESVTLKVRAKKAVGSRNFVFDVVGYSDDKLLNVTPAQSGFLQNPSGVQVNNIILASQGTHPFASGFNFNSNDFMLGGDSISEKDEHYQTSGNAGGDHYSLTTYPIVNSTEFADYEIPLQIFDDNVKLGLSRNYRNSSLFEKLYLDIYPIPSGASISDIHLLVRFAPQDAIQLSIEGGENIGKISDGRSEGKIFPTSRRSNDLTINAGSGYAPLSTIQNIPHAYSSPNTIKSNYARRWRGLEGLTQGPFDPNQFGFSFYNPLLEFPFNFGFYDFDYDDGHTIVSRNSNNNGVLHTNYSNGKYRYKNIGWRFNNHTIFNDQLPGYTGIYQTTDWTSLSKGGANYTTDPLYGQIADAFNNIIRIKGHDSYVDFNHGLDISDGFSVYLKFTPDVNVSGANYNLFNSGVLVSKWGRHNTAGGKLLEFAIAYENGYLCGLARDTAGNIIKITDTAHYSEYQYPLPVILTYNEKGLSGLKLYTDNEFAYPWSTLRASSSPFDIYSDDSDVVLGFSTGSGVGMNMFVSEFGLASGCKIVESGANLLFKETTADTFLANQRVKWFDPSESYTNDRYSLWQNIDEDTYSDWHIGDFKYCEFDASFDFLTKRTGRDLISFNIISDGLPYYQKTNIALPSSINSGVSYHTQIENDFLRFHLSDTPNNFWSVHRRITKALPQGYCFSENALIVDTVIEHETDNEISWNECTPTRNVICTEDKHSYDTLLGPKLIVSLYTKRQEPQWSKEPNWGLINRDIHYLPASSCMIKLSSKFSYDNLIDESERWSLFPNEPRYKDFGERYFSQDVDDMFLQYDLVYPSGPPYQSNIKIHSAHVRMEDANVYSINATGNMNIFASGGNVLNQFLPTLVQGGGTTISSGINVSISGSLVPISGLNMNVSGAFPASNSLNFYTFSRLIVSSGINLNTSGEFKPITGISGAFNLVMPLTYDVRTAKFPLTILNTDTTFLPSGGYLNLFTYAATSGADGQWTGIRSIFTPMNIAGADGDPSGPKNASLPINIFGFAVPENRFPSINMPLFIDAPITNDVSMPLFINSDMLESGVAINAGMNLFFANYAVGSFIWYNENYGMSISQQDNIYASVPVGNEIRGVDLIGYGSCTGNSPRKAIDPPLITDNTVWREATCEEGGIFRAISTYTNPTATGFGNTVGYSGNYYGIRKYPNLKTGTPYDTTVSIVTGSTKAIKVPRDLEDWEYGHCGPDHFLDSGCCPQGCDQSIVYSGVKFIGDYPYLKGNKNITPPSGRNTDDQYGKAVSVVGNLMAIGAPKIHIPYIDPVTNTELQIDDAGSVYLYRRNEDIPGRKAAWLMEDKLMLPSGFRKDFIAKEINELIKYDQFAISGKQWAIGQEGRYFGSSLDLCSSGDRETVVIGAPFAKWTRQFDNIVTSGIPIAMMVFTDSFTYDKKKIEQIATVAQRYNILYKYFSAPWNGGTSYEFQPQLEIKLLVFELINSDRNRTPVNHDNNWFRHRYLDRMDDKNLITQVGSQAVYNGMFSGVKEEFHKAFEYAFGPHSGIPPIVGIFRETSNSAGLAAFLNPTTNKNIVSEFIDYYQNYAYDSGVIDPSIIPPHNKASGYYNRILAPSEDWAQTSINLLNTTLDSGNLIRNNALKYITSGVGQEWAKQNAYDFQIPPSSGGRVYIFEKESGVFNCVQEIRSFADRASVNFPLGGLSADNIFGFGSQYNDRYGHAVSISKNSEIISIGSPFTYTPCEIYQRDDSENTRMYSKVREFLVSIGNTSAVQKYDSIVNVSGIINAQKISYHEMSPDNKFRIRLKYDIQLYKPIFNYQYSDIQTTGTWQFIVSEFAGTSRLGYSTAVSDDGDIVAFGAPTDSTTLFEDTNVWYKGADTWASYTNAGAVRVFESKKIFPHSGVIEFTRFGNLDRNVHSTERNQGLYDQMGLYFEVAGLPFRRTDFEEIEIPRDAGLAFIITPELDADSDEIIDNIKNWLALGDRTLVLVGNDPVYEENGLYKKSNDIVNRILKKLGSRMTIVPAADRVQSLPDCISSDEVFNNKYNVTKAFKPDYNYTNTYPSFISNNNIFAKGVGDIKIDLSQTNILGLNSVDIVEFAPCNDENPQTCSLPLKHLGDLRAQWNESCLKTEGDRVRRIPYKKNWPWHFANPNPAQSCDDYPVDPRPYINKPYQDIVPILTAAEWLPDTIINIAARSGISCRQEPCFKTIIIPEFTERKKFVSAQENFVAFSVLEDQDSNFSGIYKEYNPGTFFDPEIKNGRDGILQASGKLYAGTPIEKDRILLPDSILAIEEAYTNNSNIIIMASLLGENIRSFGATGDDAARSENNDENILFYVNLISSNCNKSGAVLQLGGWTGRSSFKNAYASNSIVQDTNILKDRLEAYNIIVQENVVNTDLTTGFLDYIGDTPVTTLWIANPLNIPDNLQIGKIQEFLNRGNKKLIITYFGNDPNTRQQIAENVNYICDKLNIQSRPCYVPSIGEYFVQTTNSIAEGNGQQYPYQQTSSSIQKLNPNTIPTTGCLDGYGFYPAHLLEPVNTKVGKLALWRDGYTTFDSMGGINPYDYIPISGGGNFKKIISYNDPIKDKIIIPTELYKIESTGIIKFPTVKDSGYRIFFDFVSETDNEYYYMAALFSPVIFDPNDDMNPGQNGFIRIDSTIARDPDSKFIDFVAKSDEVIVNIQSIHTRIKPEEELNAGRSLPPFTPRLLSVSGCPIEIETVIETRNREERVPCDPPYTEICTPWFEPARQIIIPGEFRPIKHASQPYCDPYAPPCPDEDCCDPRGETEIEDGPIIAAEEFEHFSAGLNGTIRSKIVVITDSTILQGQCPQYRSDALAENQQFIRSLYPKNIGRFNLNDAFARDIDNNLGGRKFEFTQKLRAPERGSAAKYFAVSGIPNTISPLYGKNGVLGNLNNYVDNEDDYLPSNPGFIREKNPIGEEKIKQEIKKFGRDIVPIYGIFPRFSGDFLNTGSYTFDGETRGYITDANIAGGIPELMKLTGKDYLDFEYFTSGCPGDLFGFSVDISQNKIIVGTPFNAFNSYTAVSGVSGIVQWHEIKNGPAFSGIDLCVNGGAGAAFYFERTGSGTNIRDKFLPWQFKEKLKPQSVNVGMVVPSVAELSQYGNHNLDSNFISIHGRKPDCFGYSVGVDADMIAIGAPNHDFESLHDHSIYRSGEFIRKEFNAEFMIPSHKVYDLGLSGIRSDLFQNTSGTMVMNNGAVFTYRHKITDWQTRKKNWLFSEKLYAQGYRDRIPSNKFVPALVSGCENDNFGWSVAINRANRGDSDYTLICGAPFHDFATSGNHPLSAVNATPNNGLQNAGAAYTFDGMLREQTPSIPNSGGWIDVEVFGDRTILPLKTRVYQPVIGDPQKIIISGLIFANQDGNLFLECSGFDPSAKGFIAHRPYVESVIGLTPIGEPISGGLTLNIFGKPNSIDNAWPWLVGDESFSTDFAYDMNSLVHRPSGMALYILGPESANVYNTLGINIAGISGFTSGTMPLYITAPSGSSYESLNLNLTSTQTTGTLNLSTRGR